jgi:methyl-accepting chemotaxis protein
VTPSFDRGGRIAVYHSNRRVPYADALPPVKALYAQMVAEESRHSNWQKALAASTQLLAVASACEHLNATSGEIKAQFGHAVGVTHQAVDESDRSVEAIRQLGEAAQRIGSVIGLIARIAGNTNMLALNATIEAARAGTHGAGFAVVANQVKLLSQDTAKATGDISRTVEEMLRATEHAAAAIAAIGTSVKEVDANASSILVSLNEQVRATAEIANRISAVADQTRRMSSQQL